MKGPAGGGARREDIARHWLAPNRLGGGREEGGAR